MSFEGIAGGGQYELFGELVSTLTAATFASAGIGLAQEAAEMLAARVNGNMRLFTVETCSQVFGKSVSDDDNDRYTRLVEAHPALDTIPVSIGVLFNAGRFAQALIGTAEIRQLEGVDMVGAAELDRAISSFCPPPRFPPIC